METLSALLRLCTTGEASNTGFGVFFQVSLKKRFNEQSIVKEFRCARTGPEPHRSRYHPVLAYYGMFTVW